MIIMYTKWCWQIETHIVWGQDYFSHTMLIDTMAADALAAGIDRSSTAIMLCQINLGSMG